MHTHWYICDSSQDAGLLKQTLHSLYPQSAIETLQDLQHVRMTVRAGRERASVLVGPEVFGLTPINVAAALVHDASCEEVVLAAREPSGSLRSRAARAGIARVINLNDFATFAPGPSACEPFTCENQPQPPVQGRGSAQSGHQAAATGTTLQLLAADKNGARVTISSQQDFSDLDEPDVLGGTVPGEQAMRSGAALEQESQAAILAQPDQAHLPVSTSVQPLIPACPVVLVASGRGGCGKTLTVAALALAAASWGLRVAVADLDLGQGNLAATFGVSTTHELASVVQQNKLNGQALAQALVPVTNNVELLGPCQAPELAEVLSPHIGSLIVELSRSHDLVLIDSSTTWTDAVAQAAQICSRLLLVQDVRHGGSASLVRVAGLARRLGVASTRIVRVDNFAQDPQAQEPMLHHAETGIEQLHSFLIPDGREDLRSLVDEGQLLSVDPGDSFALGAWAHMLAKLLEELGVLPETPEAHAARDARPQFKHKGVLSFLRRWDHVAS